MSKQSDQPPPDQGFAIKHELFVLDANLTSPLDQTNMESLTRGLVDDLLDVLGLTELGPLEMYPATDMRAPGWSFLQPITTSHISGHYFEKPGKHPHIHIDVYSCDTVKWHGIVKIVHKHLPLEDWKASFIDRAWGDDERSYIELWGHGPNIEKEIHLSNIDRAPKKAISAKIII